MAIQLSGSLAITGSITINGEPVPSGSIASGVMVAGTGTCSIVGTGCGNSALGDYSFAGGGCRNDSSGLYSFVGGGTCNVASGCNSFTGGGNCSTASGIYSFIGAGYANRACGVASAVVAGNNNYATGANSTILGGNLNCTSCTSAVIISGYLNRACNCYASVINGYSNTASGKYSFIGGGNNNCAIGCRSAIVGGNYNCACAYVSFIGGGQCSTASGNYSVIGGGCCNTVSGANSSILGGQCNTISGFNSGILGGCNNTLGNCNSFIIGSGLTSAANDTTYVSNLDVIGNITGSNATITGNLGIGLANPSFPLEVSSTSTTLLGRFTSNQTNAAIRIVNSSAGLGRTYSIGSGNSGSAAINGFYIYDETGGYTALAISGSGNVGIGTTTPSQKLEVVGGEIKAGRVDSSNEGGQVSFGRASDNNTAWYIDAYSNSASPQLRFVNVSNATVAMTLTGSNVGIGTSSPIKPLQVNAAVNAEVVQFNNTRNNGSSDFVLVTSLGSSNNNTSNYHYIGATGGADRVYIYGNGNIVNANGSYGTISDISLKENIVDATPKLADLIKLKVRNFNLIENNEKQIGFIAQEFEEVFPSMINVDGKSGMKTIKTSVLIPMLVKAIQEQQAIIEELTTRLTALENK